MDPLSQLVSLLDPRGRMDLRCLFGHDWAAPHDAVGPWRAPFHIVLRGHCELWLPQTGATVPLAPGSLVVLPRGAAHVLRSATAQEGETAGEMKGEATGKNKSETTGEKKAAAIRTREGDLVALKTNLRRPASADTEILCGEFEFTGRRRSLLLDALPEPLLVPFGARPGFAWIDALVRLMSHEIETRRPGAEAIVAELSGTLFTLAVRACLDTQPALGGVLGLMASPRLAGGLQAMLERPGEAWTVATLAQRCHMSRATFAREFARCAGTGPLELLTTLRMELASRLLVQGRQDTASVGEAVGYRSEAAFNRAFARHAGTTPGRFRRVAAVAPAGALSE